MTFASVWKAGKGREWETSEEVNEGKRQKRGKIPLRLWSWQQHKASNILVTFPTPPLSLCLWTKSYILVLLKEYGVVFIVIIIIVVGNSVIVRYSNVMTHMVWEKCLLHKLRTAYGNNLPSLLVIFQKLPAMLHFYTWTI